MAQFRSLVEPWADTGTSTGRLMLAVLGGLADVERELVRTRAAEGRSRATRKSRPRVSRGHEPLSTFEATSVQERHSQRRLTLFRSPL